LPVISPPLIWPRAYFDLEAEVGWTVVGAHTAYNGWLLRAGPTIGAAILAAGRA